MNQFLRLKKKIQARDYFIREWKDGSTVALGVGEDPRNVGGIGFIVSKEWSKSIESLDVSRPRIGVLTINLQKQQTLHIIQVYAPTSAADDEEIERFYNDLEEEINKRSTYLVIMGDLNAKVGHKQDNKTFIGPFGGDHNERGEHLAAMAESRRLFIANTFFQKDLANVGPGYPQMSKVTINSPPTCPSTPRYIPDVLSSKVHYTLQQADNSKEPGKDRIMIKMFKAGGLTLWQVIADCFSQYIWNLQTPSQWNESKTVLLFKKGDKEELKNYCPICILSSLYKLFTNIVVNSLTRECDEQQPKEQASF
uniref:Craniofacial development protein 2-like n=1 Tax=Plectus sambesii TaxID=2011161 RepID=A0A914WP47_9BILA